MLCGRWELSPGPVQELHSCLPHVPLNEEGKHIYTTSVDSVTLVRVHIGVGKEAALIVDVLI